MENETMTTENTPEATYKDEVRIFQIYHQLRDNLIKSPADYAELSPEFYQLANQMYNSMRDGGLEALDAQFEVLKGANLALRRTPDMYLIDKARSAKDVPALYRLAPEFAKMDEMDCGIFRDTLKEEVGTKFNKNDFNKYVNKARTALTRASAALNTEYAQDDLDSIAIMFKDRFSGTWTYDINTGNWLMWSDTHWKILKSEKDVKRELDKIFIDLLHERGMLVNSSQALDSIQRFAKTKWTEEDGIFETTTGLVNFKNGTLHVTNMTMIEHCKEDHLTYCLPYEYSATGEYTNILTWLSKTFLWELEDKTLVSDPYAVQALMMQIGLALMGNTSLDYVIFCIGVPGAGKSTILDLANYTVGIVQKLGDVEYADHFIFSNELEGKRARYKWYNQNLACVDELPVNTLLHHEESYKKMSAHGSNSVRGMNKDEEASTQWHPKMIINSNDPPVFKDKSNSFKRRNIYICAPVVIPDDGRLSSTGLRKDPKLLLKMEDEIGAFARECIRLAVIAEDTIGHIPASDLMRALSEDVSLRGSFEKQYVEDRLKLGPEQFCLKEELYNDYKKYCMKKNYTKYQSEPEFISDLFDRNMGIKQSKHPIRKTGYAKPDGEPIRARFMLGVSILPDGEVNESVETCTQDYLDKELHSRHSQSTGNIKSCAGYKESPEATSEGVGTTGTGFSTNNNINKDTPYRYKGKGVGVSVEEEEKAKNAVPLCRDAFNPPVEPSEVGTDVEDNINNGCADTEKLCRAAQTTDVFADLFSSSEEEES